MAIIGTNDTATVRVASLPSGAAFDNATNVAVTPTGGISATTVQAALAELDTEKAPLSNPNFTTGISLAGVRVPERRLITVAQDAVGTITPPFNSGQCGGFCFVVPGGDSAFPRNFIGAAFRYDTGGSLEILGVTGLVGSQASLVTTDVTGTTGASGWVTYAARAGQIKIENRYASSLTFLVTFV